MTTPIDVGRELDDLRKRIERLERAAEQKPRHVYGVGAVPATSATWCDCGRDVCRAPDCPSHKHDPMGR